MLSVKLRSFKIIDFLGQGIGMKINTHWPHAARNSISKCPLQNMYLLIGVYHVWP